MAEQMLDSVRDALDGPIDFEGQRLAEQMTTNLLAIIGAIAFIVGYLTQNIHHALWSGLGGTVLTFLVIVPPWPFFNKSPVHWLPAQQTGMSGVQISVDGEHVQ